VYSGEHAGTGKVFAEGEWLAVSGSVVTMKKYEEY